MTPGIARKRELITCRSPASRCTTRSGRRTLERQDSSEDLAVNRRREACRVVRLLTARPLVRAQAAYAQRSERAEGRELGDARG